MKMQSTFIVSGLALITLSLVGCKTKNDYLGMPLMSMSERYVAKPLSETGVPVTVNYCTGETPVSTTDVNAGIIDELITRAERASKTRFIKNVQISTVTSPFSQPCFELTGTGYNYAN